jgi:predicted membrane protein
MSVVFLAIGIALLVNVVRLFISGELDPETGTGPVGALLAFDHAMFIGVMTNALFAAVAAITNAAQNRLVLWAVNGGLAVFLIGLIADTAVLKQIGAPIMGLALLYGIYVYFTAMGSSREPAFTP